MENIILSAATALLLILSFNTELAYDLRAPMPCLVWLRSISLAMHYNFVNPPWFLEILSTALSSSRTALHDLIVIYRPIRSGFDIVQSKLDTEIMTTLDAMLTTHPASPYLRFRFDIHQLSAFEEECIFPLFLKFVQKGMPMTHARGRLVVETCSYEAAIEDWSRRRRVSWCQDSSSELTRSLPVR